jgi:Cu+-exporting ATPase
MSCIKERDVKAYFCPMHPEIRSDTPGSCSICGMALITDEEEELDLLSKRFWISLFLTLVVLASHERLLQALFTFPVVFWGGLPFFKSAFSSKTANMFTLITLGTSVSYFYSLFGSYLYFETAAIITTLVLLGQYLEAKAHKKSRSALHKLLRGQMRLFVQEIKPGDAVIVKKGETIPVDGVLEEGKQLIDESMLTGESIPVVKIKGDTLYAGTINVGEQFTFIAEAVGSDTLLSRIISMTEAAMMSQPPVQKLVDKICSYFVPFVILLAIVTFFVWLQLTTVNMAIEVTVSVLVIACPCALGLATPLSIVVAIGKLASRGVLVKNAQALDLMTKVDTLAFDKTGTLTEGKPSVVSYDSKHLLQLAASLEKSSLHPLAHAILQKASDLGIALLPVTDLQTVVGKGIEGKIDGSTILVGSSSFVPFAPDVAGIHVSENGAYLGKIVVEDPIRATSPNAIKELHQMGITTICLTGDRMEVARLVADQVGIDRVQAGLLPEDKYEAIRTLQNEGRVVAYAGDGFNDAPALMQASCSIAMGSGVDIAIEKASVTLVKPDLRGVVDLVMISRKTGANIKQNLAFAFGYNLLALPIAAGLFYPFFGLLLDPMVAAGAMVLSSLSVVLNALKLNIR